MAIAREVPSCHRCASTVRERAIVHLLTSELLGQSMALPDMSPRKDLIGIGLSDADCYAEGLAATFSYTNTFLHTRPRFDVAHPSAESALYDFIIASDVFEHVAPPVSRAFVNVHRLLKPNGVFIFSVPFNLGAETVEHFPRLHDYRLVEDAEGWRLDNLTIDGEAQLFRHLVFHGGAGTTLEMRVFSRAGLERDFAAAGFERCRFADEACSAYGIYWPQPWSLPVVARAN